MTTNSWDDIIDRLQNGEAHQDLRVRKSHLPPRPPSFRTRIGLPLNVDHYSKPLKGGGGIHLKDFPRHYVIHRDHADANEEPLHHLVRDTSASDKILIGLAALAVDHYLLDGAVRKRVGRKINDLVNQLFPSG